MKTEHTINSKALLWAAVEKWSIHKYGKINISKLATDAGLGLGTAARLKDKEVTMGLDKVSAIAESFGVPTWQFLDPSFDPSNPRPNMSPEATDLGKALDRITDPIARRRAYALAMQVVDLAKTPADFVPSVP